MKYMLVSRLYTSTMLTLSLYAERLGVTVADIR